MAISLSNVYKRYKKLPTLWKWVIKLVVSAIVVYYLIYPVLEYLRHTYLTFKIIDLKQANNIIKALILALIAAVIVIVILIFGAEERSNI